MRRRSVLKAAGASALGIGLSSPVSALPDVGAPEVENSCGVFYAPFSEAELEIDDGEVEEDTVPDDPFTVQGSYLTFTMDSDTYSLSDVQFHGMVTGEQIFESIELSDDEFAWTNDSTRLRQGFEVEGSAFDSRARHRFEDRDRLRLRFGAADCENGVIHHDLRTNNMVTYWVADGFEVARVDADTVFIARDATENTDEPLLARIDGGPGTPVLEANNTRIRFAGEGSVAYRVITAPDQIPEAECLPVLCQE